MEFSADPRDEDEPDWNSVVDFSAAGEKDTETSSASPDNGNIVIVHVDIDCFYAQVETLKDPDLRDKMFGVRQKNLVVTTNYVARRAGVPKTGSVADLTRRFPELVLVNGEDLHDYRRYSQRIFEVLQEFGCPVEKLGMDENFLDVTRLVDDRMVAPSCTTPQLSGHVYGEEADSSDYDKRIVVGSQIAREVRDLLRQRVNVTCSAGVAHNKLLAKLVGGKNKPDDQTVLFERDALGLMNSLKEVGSIPGIGHSTFGLLKGHDIVRVSDLQSTPLDVLAGILGSPEAARRIRDLSFGVDPSRVKQSGRVLSIGLEDSFKNISTEEECREKLRWLLGRLAKLLFEDGRTPLTIKVSVRNNVLGSDEGDRQWWHKECRQCKIGPSLFADLKTSDRLSQAREEEVMATTMKLLQKVVSTNEQFHLTSLGLAVGDFVAETKSSKSIADYFKGNNSKKRSLEDAGSQSMQGERTVTPEIPADWDLEVFKSLPSEMQQELLSSSPKQPVEQQPFSAKKSKPNILAYFKKQA